MLENQLYREALLEIFRSPPNRGEIAKPDLEARLVNPLCGDEIKIQIKLAGGTKQKAKNKIIKKAVFTGNGCAISQASASLLAAYIERKKISEVEKLDVDDVIKLIGITPTPARLKCAVLGQEVLKEAIKKMV